MCLPKFGLHVKWGIDLIRSSCHLWVGDHTPCSVQFFHHGHKPGGQDLIIALLMQTWWH